MYIYIYIYTEHNAVDLKSVNLEHKLGHFSERKINCSRFQQVVAKRVLVQRPRDEKRLKIMQRYWSWSHVLPHASHAPAFEQVVLQMGHTSKTALN